MTYALVKSFHIGAVMLWMAGMLFAPLAIVAIGRLTGDARRTAAERCRRLYQRLSTPGILVAWVLGLTMLTWGDWLQSAWMISKLALVVVLSALHGMLAGQLRRVATDAAYRPSDWVAALCPLQIVAVFLVVSLVIVKPI